MTADGPPTVEALSVEGLLGVEGLPAVDGPYVMGVVNVTPDSFSDGGLWNEPSAAVAHGRQLVCDGAHILDVGGESTRPGAERPARAEELARVLPVVRALADDNHVVSIDTMRAEVAAAAIEAGASVVNDVSGGLSDPAMLDVVRDAGVAYVCMHWRGYATTMQDRAAYGDVVADVKDELRLRVQAIDAAGIAREKVVLDPGIGFAKLAHHNWEILRRLDELDDLGLPLLVGASRKAFLGSLLADAHGTPRAAVDRDDASVAVAVLAAQHHTWGVRVHNVRATCDGLAVLARWRAKG